MKVALILLFLACVGLAFSGGVIFQHGQQSAMILEYFNYNSNSIEVEVEEAVMWLDRAAYSHQIQIDYYPSEQDGFHQGCIDRYASIKRLILSLEQ